MSGMLLAGERFVAAFPSLIRIVGPGSAIILQHMYFRADAEGVIQITQQEISDETGIPLRTTSRALAWLREHGYLMAKRSSATDATLVYKIDVEALEKARQSGGMENAGSADSENAGSADSSLENEQEDSSLSTEPQVSGAPGEQRADVDAFQPKPLDRKRKIRDDDTLSKSTGEWFLRKFPAFTADDIRMHWQNFVSWNVEHGRETESAERTFLQWMTKREGERRERRKSSQEGVTDDMGRPLNQRPAPRGPAEPGDPDYVSPEELLASALGAETIEETPRDGETDGADDGS